MNYTDKEQRLGIICFVIFVTVIIVIVCYVQSIEILKPCVYDLLINVLIAAHCFSASVLLVTVRITLVLDKTCAAVYCKEGKAISCVRAQMGTLLPY